jgi:hypothetical protein
VKWTLPQAFQSRPRFLLSLPKIPSDVLATIEWHRAGIQQSRTVKLPHWRVTFLSSNPTDGADESRSDQR